MYGNKIGSESPKQSIFYFFDYCIHKNNQKHQILFLVT